MGGRLMSVATCGAVGTRCVRAAAKRGVPSAVRAIGVVSGADGSVSVIHRPFVFFPYHLSLHFALSDCRCANVLKIRWFTRGGRRSPTSWPRTSASASLRYSVEGRRRRRAMRSFLTSSLPLLSRV